MSLNEFLPYVSPLMSAVSTAVGAVKTAADIGDKSKIKEAAQALDDRLRELNFAVLQAQEKNVALVEKISALQEAGKAAQDEIRDLQLKKQDLARYELVALSEDVFAYRLKAAEADGEPVHHRCPTCVENGKRGLLQRQKEHGALNLVCPECRFVYLTGKFKAMERPGRAITEDDADNGPHSWMAR
ncbi:hypothetical protein [Paraburkholderia sp. BL6665CI2N2]|uniref:hypothetical protein n=1 Tax=Paraburkholderia sp. BL6665CI2N2 TaxID=1938806 RepID=UPI0010661A18|nr:hypothetical protein [Paraburkholderia sp. BL6665CI2N2]